MHSRCQPWKGKTQLPASSWVSFVADLAQGNAPIDYCSFVRQGSRTWNLQLVNHDWSDSWIILPSQFFANTLCSVFTPIWICIQAPYARNIRCGDLGHLTCRLSLGSCAAWMPISISKDEGDPGLYYWLLESLGIACRSYHNCEILLEMQLLPTIEGFLKVSPLCHMTAPFCRCKKWHFTFLAVPSDFELPKPCQGTYCIQNCRNAIRCFYNDNVLLISLSSWNSGKW